MLRILGFPIGLIGTSCPCLSGLSRTGILFSTKQSYPRHSSMRCRPGKASVHSTRIALRRLTIVRSPTTRKNGRRQYLIGPSATVSELRRREGSFLIFSSGERATKLRSPGGIPEFRGHQTIFASWLRPGRRSWIHVKLQVTYIKRSRKRQKHYPRDFQRAFVSRSCRKDSLP